MNIGCRLKDLQLFFFCEKIFRKFMHIEQKM